MQQQYNRPPSPRALKDHIAYIVRGNQWAGEGSTSCGASAKDGAGSDDVIKLHLVSFLAGIDVPESGAVAGLPADVLRAPEALHLDRLGLLHTMPGGVQDIKSCFLTLQWVNYSLLLMPENCWCCLHS